MKTMKVLEMGWKRLYLSGLAKSMWGGMSWSLGWSRIWELKRSDIRSI
jgi:hypothetical protein